MLKNLIILIVPVILYSGCTTGTTTSNKVSRSSKISKSTKQLEIGNDLTDSVKLVKLLHNLVPAKLPFNTENPTSEPNPIDLSVFKDKKLMDLKLKLRNRAIGGSEIDGENAPSTFDLIDSTYRSNWLLIDVKPHFFLVKIDETLVALTYKLNVIDAIHIEGNDPSGNNHFHGILNTTISKDLSMKLNYYYEVQIDEERNFDTQIEDDYWTVDTKGHFKFKKTKTVKDLNP